MRNYTRIVPVAFSVAVVGLACAVLLLVGGSLLPGASAQRINRQRRNVQQVDVDRGTIARAESYTRDRFNYFTETPRGVRVVAVNRPGPAALRAIDDGLTDLFVVARRAGYRLRLNYADYVVFIAHADRTRDSTGAYSPDMSVGAGVYAGSVYDRGGAIYVAGIVSSYSPGAIVVAEHERDFGRMANVVRYEGEHLVLYHNDRRRFQETADHTRGGAHPILR